MRILSAIALVIGSAALAAPASAIDMRHMGYGISHDSNARPHHDGRFRDRGASAAVTGDWYVGGDWAEANNRSWSPDSFNDWWHDRPDRAYPRWVQEQQRTGTCDEDRMWWSGSGWRC